MSVALLANKIPSEFYKRVKADMKVFSNISCILEKVEHDGNLFIMEKTFKQVL